MTILTFFKILGLIAFFLGMVRMFFWPLQVRTAAPIHSLKPSERQSREKWLEEEWTKIKDEEIFGKPEPPSQKP